MVHGWQAWDAAALRAVQGWASPGMDWAMSLASNPTVMVPLGLALAVWVTWGMSPWRAAYLVGLVGLLLFLNESVVSGPLKDAVGRPRPHQSLVGCRRVEWRATGPRVVVTEQRHLRPRGASFPSSHMLNNVALLLALGTVTRRRGVWIVMGVWCVVMGLSRVYTGSHFPSDVLGSALLGLAYGVPVCRLLPVLLRRALPRWAPNLLDEPRGNS